MTKIYKESQWEENKRLWKLNAVLTHEFDFQKDIELYYESKKFLNLTSVYIVVS